MKIKKKKKLFIFAFKTKGKSKTPAEVHQVERSSTTGVQVVVGTLL